MRQVCGFQVGEVLRTAIAVYGRNLRALVALTLVAYLPMFVLVALYPEADPPAIPPLPANADSGEVLAALMSELKAFYVFTFWYVVVEFFCSSWLQGSATFVVVRALRAGPPTMAQAFWQSWRALGRVGVVTVLSGLAIGAASLLLVVPGIIVMLMLWVAIPAAVVERRYGSALRRSHALTLGHKVPIFGLVLLLVVFGVAAVMVLTAMVSDLAPRFAPLVEALVGAVAGSIGAVIVAVCYHDLRVLKEGANSNVVAKVFE